MGPFDVLTGFMAYVSAHETQVTVRNLTAVSKVFCAVGRAGYCLTACMKLIIRPPFSSLNLFGNRLRPGRRAEGSVTVELPTCSTVLALPSASVLKNVSLASDVEGSETVSLGAHVP